MYNQHVVVMYIIIYAFLLNLGAKALTNSFRESSDHFHFKDLNCNGSEDSLFDCTYNQLSNYNCYRYDDASVICQCKLCLFCEFFNHTTQQKYAALAHTSCTLD